MFEAVASRQLGAACPLRAESTATRCCRLVALENQAQVATRLLEATGHRAPVGRVARLDQPCASQVANQILQLAGRDRFAEKLGRSFRQLVRFIKDDRVDGWQQFGHRRFAQRKIGAEKVVIDHHHIGCHRFAPGLKNKASLELRTLLPETVVASRGGMNPDRIILGQRGTVGTIAAQTDLGELPDLAQLAWHLRIGKAPIGHLLVEVMVTDIIRPPLEQGDAGSQTERRFHRRQVAMKELVLKRTGSGRDHGPCTRQQQRHEIGEGLAGAGAGLGNQTAALRDGPRDAGRQGLLTFSRLEGGHGPGERPLSSQGVNGGLRQRCRTRVGLRPVVCHRGRLMQAYPEPVDAAIA